MKYISAGRTFDSATRIGDSPTNNEGRFIRCNIKYQTADSGDQDENDEGGLEVKST